MQYYIDVIKRDPMAIVRDALGVVCLLIILFVGLSLPASAEEIDLHDMKGCGVPVCSEDAGPVCIIDSSVDTYGTQLAHECELDLIAAVEATVADPNAINATIADIVK